MRSLTHRKVNPTAVNSSTTLRCFLALGMLLTGLAVSALAGTGSMPGPRDLREAPAPSQAGVCLVTIPETRANYETSGFPDFPSACALNGTAFVVVWQDGRDGTQDVWARLFDSTGANLTAEFRVNENVTNTQEHPSACALNGTAFAVAWQDIRDGTPDVWARVFDSTGANLTTEFRVNENMASKNENPSACALNGTAFAVAWQSNVAGDRDVYARVFDSTGANLTAEFRVNDYASNDQNDPSACALNGTTFAVAWRSNVTGDYDIHARVFDSTGANLTAEFRINDYTQYTFNPSACSLNGTAFVVAWTGWTGISGVFARVFDSTGANLTAEFRISDDVYQSPWKPSACSLNGTAFAVAWADDLSLTWDVYARVFDSTGANLTGVFRANTFTWEFQWQPSTCALNGTDFVVAWGSIDGLNFRGFCVTSPVFALNTPAEDAWLAPGSWVNLTITARAGVATALYVWREDAIEPDWTTQGEDDFTGQHAVQVPAGITGTVYLHVFANDSLGNQNVTCFRFQRDSDVPNVELSGVSDGATLPKGSLIPLVISDATGIQQVLYGWDGGANSTATAQTPGSYRIALPEEAGQHVLDVHVQDGAGNWAHRQYTFTTKSGDNPMPWILVLALGMAGGATFFFLIRKSRSKRSPEGT